MRDFYNWLRWTRSNRIEYDNLPDDELLKIYDEYYNCRCESCNRRKELGMMPVRQGENCTTPLLQLDLRRFLGTVHHA